MRNKWEKKVQRTNPVGLFPAEYVDLIMQARYGEERDAEGCRTYRRSYRLRPQLAIGEITCLQLARSE